MYNRDMVELGFLTRQQVFLHKATNFIGGGSTWSQQYSQSYLAVNKTESSQKHAKEYPQVWCNKYYTARGTHL